MLDKVMRHLIDPPLNRIGQTLAAKGATADAVTLVGLGLGLISALAIAVGLSGWLVLIPLLAGRVADGLDGAVARAGSRTDFGGYLDIACDFAFYGAIPLGFVIRDPAANGVAGAFLLFSFYVNGASFLGYAIIAEKREMQTDAQGEKSLFYADGILEGTETVLFFIALCLWPQHFVPLAWAFGSACLITATLRIYQARKAFGA